MSGATTYPGCMLKLEDLSWIDLRKIHGVSIGADYDPPMHRVFVSLGENQRTIRCFTKEQAVEVAASLIDLIEDVRMFDLGHDLANLPKYIPSELGPRIAPPDSLSASRPDTPE